MYMYMYMYATRMYHFIGLLSEIFSRSHHLVKILLHTINTRIIIQRALTTCTYIRESVDSLCRDDADIPKAPYKHKACNLRNAVFLCLLK